MINGKSHTPSKCFYTICLIIHLFSVDPCVASWTMKMLVLSFYSFLTASLLTLNFAVLSALPEPPVLAPRRGVTRRWRRQRFLERCQMRRLRLMELVASYWIIVTFEIKILLNIEVVIVVLHPLDTSGLMWMCSMIAPPSVSIVSHINQGVCVGGSSGPGSQFGVKIERLYFVTFPNYTHRAFQDDKPYGSGYSQVQYLQIKTTSQALSLSRHRYRRRMGR